MRFANIWRFNNYRLSPQEGGGGTPPAGTPDPNQPPAGNPDNPPTPPAGDNGAPPAGEAHDVKSLPAWAQTLISTVRGEAATHRKKATDFERQQQETERKRLEDLNEWEKLAKAYKTDLDRIAAERDGERVKAIVSKLQAKHSLPDVVVWTLDGKSRLVGATEEELEADAERIKNGMPAPQAPNLETGKAGATKPGQASLEELKKRKAATGNYSGV